MNIEAVYYSYCECCGKTTADQKRKNCANCGATLTTCCRKCGNRFQSSVLKQCTACGETIRA